MTNDESRTLPDVPESTPSHLLRRFVADLDADGWQGSSAELLEWLESYRFGREWLPRRNALVREIELAGTVLADFGFQHVHRRSHAARFIAIERLTAIELAQLRKGNTDGEQD